MKKVFFAVILLAVISFNSCAKKITKPIDVQAELTNKNEQSTIVNKQDEIVCSTIIATTYTIKEYNEAIDKIKLENEKEQLRISKLSGDELHNEFRKRLSLHEEFRVYPLSHRDEQAYPIRRVK